MKCATALGNIPVDILRRRVVSVLSVFDNIRDHQQLQAIFKHTNWRISGVSGCKDASRTLESGAFGVVICDTKLCDGDWKTLLKGIRKLDAQPLLIVASEINDVSLWAEVINLGAYEALAKPFSMEEVIRVVSLAWLFWRELPMHPPKAPAAA
jgi:DNA-binding NtrC family response regulator